MKTTVLQIAGIALYELKMQWRRRTMLIIMAVFLFAVIAIRLPAVPLTERYDNIIAQLPMGVMILLAVIPAMTAEIVPIDKQLGVYDVLRALPMPRTVYLTGKVLSVWIGLAGCLAVVALGIGLYVAITSELVLWDYVHLWLLLLPFVLLAAGGPLLAVSVLGTRREAILFSLLTTPYLFIAYILYLLYPLTVWDSVRALFVHLTVVGIAAGFISIWQERRA